jgi:hypothetical protein
MMVSKTLLLQEKMIIHAEDELINAPYLPVRVCVLERVCGVFLLALLTIS